MSGSNDDNAPRKLYRPPGAREEENSGDSSGWRSGSLSSGPSSSNWGRREAPRNEGFGSAWRRPEQNQSSFSQHKRFGDNSSDMDRQSSFSRNRSFRDQREREAPQIEVTSRLATLNISREVTKTKAPEAPPLASTGKYVFNPNQAQSTPTITPKKSQKAKEEVEMLVFKLVKDFLSLMQKDSLISELKSQLTGEDFGEFLVVQLFNKSIKMETRDKKTVFSVLKSLLEENLVTKEEIASALDELAVKNEGKDTSEAFKEHFKFFEDNGLLDGFSFGQNLLKIVTPASHFLSENKEKVKTLLADSSIKGKSLTHKFSQVFNESLSFKEERLIVTEVFSAIIAQNKEEIQRDDNVDWLGDDNYGDILKHLFSFEHNEAKLLQEIENEEMMLKSQADCLYALQNIDEVFSFKVTENQESVFELILMNLYEMFEDEAFINWSTDKYKILTEISDDEKDRKSRALNSCVQFLDFIQDHDEE